MRRVNITFDRETLGLADREARRRKVSRSEFIRIAVRTTSGKHDEQAEAEARRRRRKEAAERMDELAREFGNWPAGKILRAHRDRRSTAKP